MITKQRIDKLLKRLKDLENKNIKVKLLLITDKDTGEIHFKIKALNCLNEILEEETFKDIPRPYVDKYISKYNVIASLETYEIEKGKLKPNKL